MNNLLILPVLGNRYLCLLSSFVSTQPPVPLYFSSLSSVFNIKEQLLSASLEVETITQICDRARARKKKERMIVRHYLYVRITFYISISCLSFSDCAHYRRLNSPLVTLIEIIWLCVAHLFSRCIKNIHFARNARDDGRRTPNDSDANARDYNYEKKEKNDEKDTSVQSSIKPTPCSRNRRSPDTPDTRPHA